MSGSLGDITVRFTGDASQLAATISDVQGQLSGLEGAQSRATAGSRAATAAANSYASKLQSAGKGIKEFGNSLDAITKPLQVTSLALAAGGVASAKFAIDFENDFAKVKKTVEGTPEQLKEVKQGIIDLTTTGINGKNAIPQTTKQLNELAAAGGQLGIKTPNIVDFTEVMAQMGTATNLAGAEGAATLARFMNVTDTSQDKIRNVGSAIVDLGNNFATTESEIATLGLRMGATGNVVGISAQDILGYSTALSSMGVEAEAGGSAVSRIWMDIQSAVSSGGEGLATFAKVSGKSSADFANQWKNDASGAFQTFLVGLSKSEDQVKTLEELGFNNIRDIQALQRLASSQGIELIEQALHRANTAWSENIALQKEADAMAETKAGQIQITKNNLVEAGRSIGESFLPMIAKGSAKVKDFAQDIADMSEESKERLVSVGKSIIVLGAGSKVIVGASKSIGTIIDAVGKLKNIPAAINAATEGIGALSTASSTFTAVAPALATALGWLAVPASMYVGMELWAAHLEKAEQEFLHIGDGAGEFAKTAAATITAANTANEYAKKLREVNDVISKGSDGTPEGNSAYNQAMEQRKEYVQWFTDNYGDYVAALESGNEVTNNTAAIIQKMTAAEKEAKMSELNFKVSEGGYNVGGLQESIKTYEKQNEAIYKNNSALYDLKKGLTDLNTEYSALNNQLDNKSISKGDYADNLDELEAKYKNVTDAYHELTGDDFKWANADMVADALAAIDNRLSENSSKVEENKTKIEAAKASINEYQEAARVASDVMLSELPSAIENGNGKVQEYIAKIGEYGKAVGFSFNEMGGYANQAALKLNGFNSVEEAVADKNGGLNASVRDCVNTMQQWGYSASQAAVQGALLQNGFSDIISAAKTDGGLDIIIQQANQLAKSMHLISENQRIDISVNGDISKITEVEGKIQEIDGENIDIKLNAEGDYDVLNEAGEKVGEIDGKTATVQVNTEGNYDILNAAGEKIAEIDGETGTVSLVVQGDAMPTVEQVNSAVGALDGRAASIQLNADGNYDVLDAAGEKIATLDGETATVTVATEVENTETQAPDIQGKANYEMGDHPTEAPPIDGVAKYSGDFSGIGNPPVKYGTVVYSETYKENAKGTRDFEGGLSMINDEKGISDPRELVEFGGKGYIFEGRDVVVPLPKHSKVYTAKQTKEILSARGIPHYASGKNNEAWESAKADREHIRKTSYRIIPAWEELQWLDEMKRKFASDAEVIKEIEEEVVTYTKKMWKDNLEAEQFALDMGWQSEEEYYSHLAAYRDQNFAPDTEEWKDATLKLHKYSQQLIDDANDVSKAWIDMRSTFNDWDEIGDSPLNAYMRIDERNLAAFNQGLITAKEYRDLMNDTTEDLIGGRTDYSFNWIDHAQKYEALDADGTIAGLDRVQTYVDEFFGGLGAMTDEQYAVKLDIDATLADKKMDAWKDKLSEWEDDADWYQKQAEVYGWGAMGDSETDFYQRKIDEYTDWANDPNLSENDRQYALRQADETKLELYKATEDSYDEMLSDFKDRMDKAEELFNDKMSALEKSWEVEDRAEDKTETLSDIEKYKNAVTIEGREKYQEALDKLKDIEREEEKYRLELEQSALMEQMQAEYDAIEAEKKNILEQTRQANAAIAASIEPLKAEITNNIDSLAGRIETALQELKPSLTVNQTNNMTIADATDAVIFSKKVAGAIFSEYGG